MIVKGILLDCDGVLLDSFRTGLRKVQLLCALHNIEYTRKTRIDLFNYWGMPGIELLEKCLTISRALAERMYEDWERIDKSSPPPLVPGARETLIWLGRNGFESALITSRHKTNLGEILEEMDLVKYFAVITTKEDCPYHKPDPRVFRYAFERFEKKGIEKKNCIFVGDTPADTVAGHAAELETLVVQTGPYMIEHIEKYPVSLSNILTSIDMLPFWIEKFHEGELKHSY